MAGVGNFFLNLQALRVTLIKTELNFILLQESYADYVTKLSFAGQTKDLGGPDYAHGL